MLIELLSTSNYVSYNVKLAQILGLNTAVYLSELMNVNDKAIRKNKIDNKYLVLSREYITERTTLMEEEQLKIDNNLIKIGILEKGEKENQLALNISNLTALVMTEDEDVIESIKKLTKLKNKGSRKTKAEKIKEELRTNVITDNEELKEAYNDWIDAVYAKQGWLSKKAILHAQNVIDTFTNRNLDIALKILDIAAVNGYRDMDWAVTKYKEQYKVSYQFTNNNKSTERKVSVSSEVF